MKLEPHLHDRLIKQLCAYLRAQRSQPAHVYRTHISSVIVCGEHAYKLKRPVKFAFVDFSTLALRRKDCKRELRINRRTAPALYLDVVKITGTPKRPRLGGPGKPLDWAVKIKRFEQTALLSHLIEHDGISTGDAMALGEHLAQFTNGLLRLSAPTTAHHRPTIDWLLESIQEISASYPTQTEHAHAIQTWAKRHARQYKSLINHRRRSGFYRDCHGDLHLGNLIKLGHDLIAFDALEFNRELSQIDVINDIAFAFMDFLAFERADLAWAMLNRWCEQTGDYDGLVLLRYYTLYRAVVRAKVAALTRSANSLQTFERYWSLANRLIAPANPPRLILVSGLSGSGKSTVARTLAGSLSGIQVRADVIRKQLFPKLIDEPSKLYAKAASRDTYEKLAHIADTLLTQHMTVIVDATFLGQAQVDRFDKLAKEHGIGLEVLWCEAPVATLKARIIKRASRGDDPSDATVAVLERQIEQLRNHPISWPTRALELKTNVSLATMRSRIDAVAAQLLDKQLGK